MIFSVWCSSLEQAHLLFSFCSTPSQSHGLGWGSRVSWRHIVQSRCGSHDAVDPRNYGPVTFVGCSREDIVEYAQEVAKAEGKREDPRLRSLQSTKDFENYLRKHHNKGLFGSVEMRPVKYHTMYSKQSWSVAQDSVQSMSNSTQQCRVGRAMCLRDLCQSVSDSRSLQWEWGSSEGFTIDLHV